VGATLGAIRTNNPWNAPDPAGQPGATSPRSRTDLNGSGRPHMELRIWVVPATCPIGRPVRDCHGHSRTDQQTCRPAFQHVVLMAETSLITKRSVVQVHAGPPSNTPAHTNSRVIRRASLMICPGPFVPAASDRPVAPRPGGRFLPFRSSGPASPLRPSAIAC
jgi:hypothetical protein